MARWRQQCGAADLGLAVVFLVAGLVLIQQASAQAGSVGKTQLRQKTADASDFDTLLHQGFELHQQGRYVEAILVLERARHLQPADYFANLLLGIDLLRSGKAAEAVPRLKLAARARPAEEFPEDYLGEAQAALKEYALAAEAYQQALLRGHDSEQALEAWAGFSLERFREIGATLRSSQAGLAVAHRLEDRAATQAKEDTGVEGCGALIPALERKLAVTTGKGSSLDADAAYRLSVCYASEAGRAADHLQSNAEDKAAVYRLRGDVLLRLKGDGIAAETEYNHAIALRSGDPALLERLAQAQLTAGEIEAARGSAQAALAIDPHRAEALRTLVALAMNQRDYAQALPLLRVLVVVAPGDPSVAVELGRALAQTGEPAQALQWLEPVLAAGYPDERGSAHALLARVLRTLGRDADAAKAETKARQLSDAFQQSSHASDGSTDGAPPGGVLKEPDVH